MEWHGKIARNLHHLASCCMKSSCPTYVLSRALHFLQREILTCKKPLSCRWLLSPETLAVGVYLYWCTLEADGVRGECDPITLLPFIEEQKVFSAWRKLSPSEMRLGFLLFCHPNRWRAAPKLCVSSSYTRSASHPSPLYC